MKKRPDKIDLPVADLRASLDAASIDEATRSVDAEFYTGAEVIRAPYFDEPYLLSFSMEPGAADLKRLNAGAAVVDSHSEYELDDILGVTSNARLEGGTYRATLQFSQREDRTGIWQDVKDKILRNLSMRAHIHELRQLEDDEATGLPRFQASKWEVMHIALVATGADPGAQISLSDESAKVACSVHYRAPAKSVAQNKGSNMDENIKVRLLADCEAGKKGAIVEIAESDFNLKLHTTELKLAVAAPAETKAADPQPKSKAADLAAAQRLIDEELEAEEVRKKQVKQIQSKFGLDELWSQKHINAGTDTTDLLADATAERAKRAPVGPNGISVGLDHDSAAAKGEAMAQAIVARASRKEPTEQARPFYGMRLSELAIECLSRQGRGYGLDPRADVGRIMSSDLALHTTSDFPLILANALNKMLLPEYAAATPTYRLIAEQKSFNDFRPHNFVRMGDFPNLLQVNEHGEFKYGTIGENNEAVTAATYGRVVGLSRQTLINDDLSAFADLATKAARRVADFENATFFATCITAGSGLGPDLADGNPVFDGAHGNVNAGGVLANGTLESAFALMMAQTSLDGLKLNVMPKYLLTSPTSYGLAKRLLSAVNPTQASEVNTFAGMIEPIADANLTGVRYYVLADPSVLANYVYGYVAGQGPRTETRAGFEVDGVEFKIALDFGVGAIESRGGVTGAGS